MHVIYYGQEEGPVASQLLILPAGAYRLTTRAAGASEAESLRWTLICAATNEPIAQVSLDQAISRAWRFQVSSDCPAQRLELRGLASDAPQQVDVTIQSVGLTPESPNG